MCLTEIWSYRECGCFYSHKVLCRSFRTEQKPCFASNIQYPLDKWLKETAITAETSYELFRPPSTPIEPQSCPDHQVAEKSFLNQICEDCLLAELDGIPPTLDRSASAQDVPTSISDNGEGLIWDSEVKIEIEDENSGFSASPTVPEVSRHHQGVLDVDTRILESHVQIIVEDENHSISAENAASPRVIARQRSGCSQSSLIEVSPPTTRRVDFCRPISGASGSKRYGRSFQDINVPSFDAADDNIVGSLQWPHRNPQPPFRGRSLMHSNLLNAQGCEHDADSHTLPPRARFGIKSLPKFQSLKSLSTSFRIAPRLSMVASGHGRDSTTDLTSSSSSLGSSSKNPFSNIRSWKGSPLAGETSTPMWVGLEQQSNNDHYHNIPSPEMQNPPAIPPRKSSLKNFALFLMEDFARTKGIVQKQSDSQLRSFTPSLTTSCLQDHTESGDGTNTTTQESVSHPRTVLETASSYSSPKTNGTGEMKAGEGLMIPSIPKSSTMNTMRAIINGCIDQDFGLDDPGKEEARH